MSDDHPVSTLPVHAAGDRKPLLIEQWLPIQELGIEGGRRESNPRPPLNGFHVWWARRPLAACQGAQLAAVLPPFDALPDGEFANEAAYRKWVLWLTGIHGDPVAKAAEIDAANAQGLRLPSNPYGYRPAFNNSPSVDDLNRLHRILIDYWGRLPVVLDPTAGGGAIPFSAMRYGLPTLANDLNPVAVGILEATLKTASMFGSDFVDDVQKWAEVLKQRCKDRLEPYFQRDDADESITAYIWVNTVACPRTGGPVPLAPNWWLSKDKGGVAVAPEPVWNDDGTPSHIDYRIIEKPKDHGYNPGAGTVAGGDAVSLWDEGVVDGDYIKAEAQGGRMWGELYAIAASRPKPSSRGKIRFFRQATAADHHSVTAAEVELAGLLPRWEADDILPHEDIGISNYDRGHRLYGMFRWRDMFTARQQLVHGVLIEEWRGLRAELEQAMPGGRGQEVATVLAMVQSKTLNYNSRATSWDVSKHGLRSTFDSHNYSFKWAYGEFEAADALLSWSFDSMLSKFREVMRIARPAGDDLLGGSDLVHPAPASVELTAGSAANLTHLADGAVECVNVDPPYYDNVQYAELADFFYVWEKRTLGTLYPERFAAELTDKDNEAVTNLARFDFAKGKQRRQMADADYESKMRDIFTEARRVLRDDGVLVIWFTHKKAEAWDTLGAAMMDAGFTIETSWPVNTESAVSLHQANVNAAKSTIVLVCRKRLEREATGDVFLEDIEADMRAAARQAAADFEPIVGHGGVDLMLSTYGPTLSVLSRVWPVYASAADAAGNLVQVRPEEALDVARAEVAKLRIARLVGRERRFDPTTDFVVLSWSLFADVGFPYDEARKLALGVGADVDTLIGDKVLAKKGSNVSLVDPTERVARRIKVEGPFDNLYDALSVMLRLYDTDGAAAVRSWLVEHGYEANREFGEATLALANAVPRVKDAEGEWTVELAGLLDEVASNVPTLGLRLADVEQQTVSPTATQETLAFGLET